MTEERFRRTKSTAAASAIALVVAALIVGLAPFVIGHRVSAAPQLGTQLSSSTSTFTVTSTVYPSPACTGSPALLYPGVARCDVFTVQNTLNVPITVQSVTSSLDPNFAAPPAQCAPPTSFTLPTFSGAVAVPAGASVNLAGVPIELQDSGANQSACKNLQYHFVYSGTAQFTDATSTALTSSPNPATPGQSVTFKATVTPANPSADPSLPTGSVSFYKCTTSSVCTPSAPNLLGSGSIGAGGVATLSTSTLSTGTAFVEAVYGASGTDFSGSTSNVVTQVVTSTTIGTSSSLTSSPNPSTHGASVTFTDTVSSGAGTPNGPVTFYSCTTSACGTKTSIGTGTLSSGKVTLSTSTLPVGTTYVEAVYGGSGNYLTSTSNVVTQVVTSTTIGTSSSLTSSPNPSTHGASVTFTDTVSSGAGTPNGPVTFYSCTTSACGTKTSIGTGTLSSGKVTLSTSTLPVGTTYVEAVYGGSGNYLTSTSNVVTQVVTISVPSFCTPNTYNPIVGNPWFPVLYGTSRSDFIDAFGGSYWINGLGGNDCIDAGDGNNVIFDAGGNDVVVAGNGNDAVILGDGNDKVTVGNGSDGVEAGNGNDTITLGNGWGSGVFVGDGADTVTVGGGSYNHVALGHGADSVTVQNGSHDEIVGGNGNETVFLGAGTDNSYVGQPHHTNTCHLPKPPSSWHATAAAYYHDTITNCTVVTP